jgi:membrane associated rhomboid family serine protease
VTAPKGAAPAPAGVRQKRHPVANARSDVASGRAVAAEGCDPSSDRFSARAVLLAAGRHWPYVGATTTRDGAVDRRREPIFNVPPVIVLTVAALVLVHVIRVYFLTRRQDLELLVRFAFIPARYDATPLPGGAYPGGFGAEIWTFVTYAFFHADAMHLGVNSVWLLAFGSALARRFGFVRFLAFFAITAAAGAAAHLLAHAGDPDPVIGASAAISGAMAAVTRFAFQRGGPLAPSLAVSQRSYRVAAAPLTSALRDPRVLAFLLTWFGLNALFGLGSASILGDGQIIAWQAHIGGFVAGLVLFPLFDPVPTATIAEDESNQSGINS